LAQEMNLVDYCIDAFGFNPFTTQGKAEILDLYPAEYETLKKEYPDQTEDFFADSIIQDKVVDEYKEFAEMRGFEPDFGDTSYDKSTYQKTLLNNKSIKRLIKKS
jgi:hypothetical protein